MWAGPSALTQVWRCNCFFYSNFSLLILGALVQVDVEPNWRMNLTNTIWPRQFRVFFCRTAEALRGRVEEITQHLANTPRYGAWEWSFWEWFWTQLGKGFHGFSHHLQGFWYIHISGIKQALCFKKCCKDLPRTAWWETLERDWLLWLLTRRLISKSHGDACSCWLGNCFNPKASSMSYFPSQFFFSILDFKMMQVDVLYVYIYTCFNWLCSGVATTQSLPSQNRRLASSRSRCLPPFIAGTFPRPSYGGVLGGGVSHFAAA